MRRYANATLHNQHRLNQRVEKEGGEQMNVSILALATYHAAIVDLTYARKRTPEYRRALQRRANIALCIYLRTRNMPYLADRLPSAPTPCEKCNGRGVIEGAMEFSWVGGYPDTRVYVCDCMIEDSSEIEF